MTFNRKFSTAMLALGIAAIALASITPASAATVVRDHRDKPVVRDHREAAPVIRDSRTSGASGGVTVKDTTRPRKPVTCLGSFCNKKVCIGPACL